MNFFIFSTLEALLMRGAFFKKKKKDLTKKYFSIECYSFHNIRKKEMPFYIDGNFITYLTEQEAQLLNSLEGRDMLIYILKQKGML